MTRRRLCTISATVVSLLCLAVSASPSASATALGNTGSGRPALSHAGGRLYIGWTGSSGDPAAKDLNVGWSTSRGVRIQKILVGEKSPVNEGPALVDNGTGSQGGNGTGVYIAWAAGNNANTLTAEFFDGTSLSCRTSFAGVVTPHSPALTRDNNGKRYIAWADPNSHLNVAVLDTSGCAAGRPMTLVDRVVLPDTTVAGPSLAQDNSSANLGIMLAWTGTDARRTINVATFNGTSTLTLRGTVEQTTPAAGSPILVSSSSDNYLMYRGIDGSAYLGYSEGRFPPFFSFIAALPTPGLASDIGADSPDVGFKGYFDTTGHLNISLFCCGSD